MNVIIPVIITRYFSIFSCVIRQYFNEKTDLWVKFANTVIIFYLHVFLKLKTFTLPILVR